MTNSMDLDVSDRVSPQPTTPSCPQTVIFIDRSALSASSSTSTTSVRDIQELFALERAAKILSHLPVPLRSQILLADPTTPPAELDTAWYALQPSFRSRAGAARLEIKRDKYNGQDQKQQQRSLKVLSLVMARWKEALDEDQPFAKSVFGLHPYTDVEGPKENAWMDRHRANLEQLLRGGCSFDPAVKSGMLTIACIPRRMELFLDAMSVLSSSERQILPPFLPDSSAPTTANLASSPKILLGCVATAQVESDAEMYRWSPFKIDLEAKMVYVYDVAVGSEVTTEMEGEEGGEERLSQVKSVRILPTV
ncbi:hypothetical protein BCR39DRAFT_48376 [Naematelia encephala]|uniref:Uncharacterized protein n=1 Tax=Naematelia encephala TaxID=71784 RepID=A0A1Y2AHI2_9TREE|nr:hypothetical protein BCR39DRAFT_48376 [Naematelia encephala]